MKKKKEYGIFLFPEEGTFGSPSTNKIRAAGKVREGEVVRPQPPDSLSSGQVVC